VATIPTLTTLLVALKGKDGLVLAPDSRGTFGDPRGVTAKNDIQQKAHVLALHVARRTGSASTSERSGRCPGRDPGANVGPMALRVEHLRHLGWEPLVAPDFADVQGRLVIPTVRLARLLGGPR
jgi:hypothetical protein